MTKLKYKVPDFSDLEKFVSKEPTRITCNITELTEGFISWSRGEIWVLLNRESDNDPLIPVYRMLWYHWDRNDGTFEKVASSLDALSTLKWIGSIYVLEEAPKFDPEVTSCPNCNVDLEWASLAERCPECWWVKPVTADESVGL